MKKYSKPRQEIRKLIQTNLKKLLRQAGKLHGHYCPYLALGVKAGAKGIREIDSKHEGMEEVIAIVETNNCFSDGIQYSTGCTFGNNSMIYRDYGKTAVTLIQRGESNGLRIAIKPNASKNLEEKYPRYQKLFDKVVKERSGDEQDSKEMGRIGRNIAFEIIEEDFDNFFKIENISPNIPDYAPIFESKTCSKCGESVMATIIIEKNGKKLCIPCANEDYSELNGRGINPRR